MKSRVLALFVLFVALSAGMTGQFKNFITAKGDKLLDGGDELRFVSFNIPNLHYIEDHFQFSTPNPWRLSNEFEIRDALMSIKFMGGNITRMYVLSVRKQGEEKDIVRHIESPGQFNEESFRTIDKVLQIANEVGVRIIIPFVDNWWWWGGPREYAAFRGKPKEAFWSDSLVLADLKTTISFLVNRTNTYTGVKYKDDKAILCWETGNEMEPPAYDWTRKIAAHIKSLDTNHLVSQGTNSHVITDDVMNDKNIDIVSTHNYGSAVQNFPDIRAALGKTKGKKPFFIGEFGFIPVDDMRAMIDTVISNGISGIMVWSLRAHNRDGGFYYHTNAYRFPGFGSGSPWDEQAVMSLFREKAFQINKQALTPIPVPKSPVLLPIATPNKISWLGSTGAKSYVIERRDEESGVWTTIADSASDADIAYRPLFNDKTARIGKSYYYRISARSESGLSMPSEAYGPAAMDHLTFIDEFENDAALYGRMGELKYLRSDALAQAKEDKHRLAGADGDFIVYKMPRMMTSLSLELFHTKKTPRDIRILTGESVDALKPLKLKKEMFESYKNDYTAFFPVRYTAVNIPPAHRFIKIVMIKEAQFARLEVEGQRGAFTLASIFGDSMVVQQKANVPVWGTGVVGAAVSVKASWGKEAKATVGTDSKWMTKIATPKAGGPYTVTISEYDTTVVLRNVLAGEVWLASGQSNMEMPLAGWPPADTIGGSAYEIANSRNTTIRMFTVSHGISLKPVTSLSGSWVPAAPDAAGKFSATAYFFAKALQASLHVPVGIINSSWGGTQIEPWTSAETISKIDEYKKTMELLALGHEGGKKYSDWLHAFPAIDMTRRSGDRKWAGLNFQDERCSLPDYDDSRWMEMKLPQYWERTEMGEFDGVVWFRKNVEIPASWLNKKMSVELGPVDDMDRTFVNGVCVGGLDTDGMWNMPRVYRLADSTIKHTTVSIAVRVLDDQGGGGVCGSPAQMVLRLTGTNETVSLAGQWKYLPVASYDGKAFFVFGEKGQKFFTRPSSGFTLTNATPTAIYNAMIAPLVPFTIKGAVWYQGEANVPIPELYKKLLPSLMTDWRTKFNCGDFPFYYVQIAPYAYGASSHSELLREAQLTALSAKNAGMAVTMDIGSARTIHPSHKKEVGERLASWALAKNYGKQVPYSGPVYSSMKKEKNTLVLSFDHAGKALVLKDGENEFRIAGDDKVFKPATVEIRGGTLVVSHPEIPAPAAVRYAFTDTSSGTLFNSDGLPASSFRTDKWK